MDGAIQHAPHPIRQFIVPLLLYFIQCFSQKEYTQVLDVSPFLNTVIENRLLNVLPVRLSMQLRHLLKTLSAALHLLADRCGPSESEVVIPVLFPLSSNRYQ